MRVSTRKDDPGMDPAKARQIDEALGLSQRPRDPGQGLDVVAPMDHRLGRFNC